MSSCIFSFDFVFENTLTITRSFYQIQIVQELFKTPISLFYIKVGTMERSLMATGYSLILMAKVETGILLLSNYILILIVMKVAKFASMNRLLL